MIGLYKDDGTRLEIDYNSLALNDPTQLPYSTYEVNDVVPLTAVEYVREARPADDGSIFSVPRKTQRVMRLRGEVRADTYAALYDAAEALAAATDPVMVWKLHGAALDMTFSVPTADTTNWPTGLIACKYTGIALGTLDAVTSQSYGKVVPFSIDFFLADPRRKSTGTATVTGSGTATNKGDYFSYPLVVISAAGAGSATYSIANTTTGKTVTLNLSGLVNTDLVSIDMDAQRVKKNGSDAPSLVVGTPGWFSLSPGANTITVTNGTNMTTITSFSHAWAD